MKGGFFYKKKKKEKKKKKKKYIELWKLLIEIIFLKNIICKMVRLKEVKMIEKKCRKMGEEKGIFFFFNKNSYIIFCGVY